MSYETKDASLTVIGVAAGIFAFLVVASIGTSTWIYHARYHDAGAVPMAGRNGSFQHGPEEKIGILVDYRQVTRSAAEHLHSYSWVDQRAGIARIPIERALELTAAGVKPAPAPKAEGQVP